MIQHNQRAFSLVELSIVLVILGLLTGGILTGQSLIRAAELRAVTTEYQNYQTAVMTFRDKYFSLPGDMTNATDFWGTTTCPATAGTGTQTCNGDGDGQLDVPPAAQRYGETFTFWQHLANAGLIEGRYTGMSGAGNALSSAVGVNSPSSKLSNAGWSAHYVSSFAGSAYEFAFDYDNHFRFGSLTTGSSGAHLYDGTVITPEEAWNIDTKVDDGMPGNGKIIAYNWDVCTDAATHGGTTVTDRTGANYTLTDTSAVCALAFVKAF